LLASDIVDEGRCLRKKGSAVKREKRGCKDVDDRAKVSVRRCSNGEKR